MHDRYAMVTNHFVAIADMHLRWKTIIGDGVTDIEPQGPFNLLHKLGSYI